MSVLVLAGSLREVQAWGNKNGVRRPRWAADPGLVSGKIELIVELPSWKKLRNRHPIDAAIRNYRRRPSGANVEYRIDNDWDFDAYREQRAQEATLEAAVRMATDPAERRAVLVDEANRAVEALAADMGVPPQHLIDSLASNSHTTINADKPQVVKDREADPDVKPSPEPAPFTEPEASDPVGLLLASQEGDAETVTMKLKPARKPRTPKVAPAPAEKPAADPLEF